MELSPDVKKTSEKRIEQNLVGILLLNLKKVINQGAFLPVFIFRNKKFDGLI